MFLGVLLAKMIGLQVEQNTFVLPLLATHLLWINLLTDEAPALALGMDPADPHVMRKSPGPLESQLSLDACGRAYSS